MKNFALMVLLFSSAMAYGQKFEDNVLQNEKLTRQLAAISANAKIGADSTFKLLSKLNAFGSVSETDKDYLFVFRDPVFGDIPFRVYIPKNYKPTVPSPLVMLLHGATGQGSFANAYKTDGIDKDDDIFFNHLKKENYLVLRPFADRTKNFDWVVNRFWLKTNKTKEQSINPAFNTLVTSIINLKKILNIDDNRVFAYGHSDGADGAFGLDVFEPSAFAGFVGYNSMLAVLFAHNFYLNNAVNRPLYLVHSDLDDLRRIGDFNQLAAILDSVKVPLNYKVYHGYKHYDLHLQKDMPLSTGYMAGISRNPFSNQLTWETDGLEHQKIDWLVIDGVVIDKPRAAWHKTLNKVSKFTAKDGKEVAYNYYADLNESAAVKANYNNNVFTLQTSRVASVELLISPVMVNLEYPVIVVINGKEVFKGKVMADKAFLLKNFSENYDRRALWVNSIKVAVPVN